MTYCYAVPFGYDDSWFLVTCDEDGEPSVEYVDGFDDIELPANAVKLTRDDLEQTVFATISAFHAAAQDDAPSV